MNAFRKCENLLRNYSYYKISLKRGGDDVTQRCVDKIERALESLREENYIGIIKLYYFDGLTMERIAEVYDVSTVSIYKRKKKLIDKLKTMLCSEESIREILGS